MRLLFVILLLIIIVQLIVRPLFEGYSHQERKTPPRNPDDRRNDDVVDADYEEVD